MWQTIQPADVSETYDELARAVDRLRYAFDGVDPDTVSHNTVETALDHVEHAILALTDTP